MNQLLLREREEHLQSGRGDLLVTTRLKLLNTLTTSDAKASPTNPHSSLQVHMSDVDELLDPEAILGRALPACHTPVLRMLVYGERCWSGEQWKRL